MAKSDEARMPQGPEWSLLSLLRESGDALEAESPPFDAAAVAVRLKEVAQAHALLRPDMPEGDLTATDAELEEDAPPFDVEAGEARLREAAGARGYLSIGAPDDRIEQAPEHRNREAAAASQDVGDGTWREKPPVTDIGGGTTDIAIVRFGAQTWTLGQGSSVTFGRSDYADIVIFRQVPDLYVSRRAGRLTAVDGGLMVTNESKAKPDLPTRGSGS